MMGRKGQELINIGRSDLPVSISVCQSPEYLNAYGKPEANRIFVKQLEHAERAPMLAGAREWQNFFVAQLDLVHLGKKSVSDAAKAIVRAYDQMVVKNDVLR